MSYIKKVRVAAYCRVSTEKEDQLHSLQNQKDFFKDYAVKQGYELVRVYADEGLSGTKLKNRHAFAELMEDAAAGRFERVFVKDVSRLSRNVVDFLQSVRRLRTLGVDCRFITSGMSLADGELTLTILAAVAQEESANLSKRVKFGKKKNAEQGRVPNIIYGYDKAPGDYFSLRVNVHEAAVVRQIFAWYATGEYGTGRIARLLNDKGVRTKRACAWSQATVRRMLSHRIYIGEVVNGKEYVADYLTGRREKAEAHEWSIVQNPDLAIIERDVFEKAQTILEGRADTFTAGARQRQYPLSGLLRCTCCGYSFRRLVRKTKKGETVKWVCGGRNVNGVEFCQNRTVIQEKELLEHIAGYVKETLTEQGMKNAAKIMEKEQNSGVKDDGDTKRTLQRLQRAKQKQMELFEAEAVTLDEFRARMETLRAQEQQAKHLLHPSRTEEQTLEISPQEILEPQRLDGVLLHHLISEIAVSADQTAIIRLNQLK